MNKVKWFLRGVVSIIFLQTLFFKFSGAPESVYIFQKMGMEPWGRFGSGVAELIASALILYPGTTVFGALMGLGIMGGALMSHLIVLGIDVQGDGGLLFALAMVCFFGCAVLVFLEKEKLVVFIKRLPLGLLLLFPLIGHAQKFNIDDDVFLKGEDVVSYFQKSGPVVGNKEFSADHKSVKFLFSNAENLKLFKADPEKYIPAYHGWCAYAMADGEFVEVDPKTFKVLNGKVHLFYNGLWGNTLKKWNEDEPGLKAKAEKSWASIQKKGESK